MMNNKQGIPGKKYAARLNYGKDYSGRCQLLGDQIYLVRTKLIDGRNNSELYKIDLTDLPGSGLGSPFFVKDNADYISPYFNGNYLWLDGTDDLVFDHEAQEIVIGGEEKIGAKDWGEAFGSFVADAHYYRSVDYSNPEKFFDVYDLESRKFIERITLPNFGLYKGAGLYLVKLGDSGWAIYDLNKKEQVLTLEREKYFYSSRFPRASIYSVRYNDKLYMVGLYNLVVVDLLSMEVDLVHNVLETADIQRLLAQYKVSDNNFTLQGIDVVNNYLVIYGKNYFDFVMCFDLSSGLKEPLWVYAMWRDLQAKYVGGDLIYGMEDKRPIAWDLYTGEVIWKASSLANANKIDVGDGWVVYSQWGREIHCYHWKKPYISPHKPK